MAGQYLEDSLTYSSCKQANVLVHVSSVIREAQLIFFVYGMCKVCINLKFWS